MIPVAALRIAVVFRRYRYIPGAVKICAESNLAVEFIPLFIAYPYFARRRSNIC